MMRSSFLCPVRQWAVDLQKHPDAILALRERFNRRFTRPRGAVEKALEAKLDTPRIVTPPTE